MKKYPNTQIIERESVSPTTKTSKIDLERESVSLVTKTSKIDLKLLLSIINDCRIEIGGISLAKI